MKMVHDRSTDGYWFKVLYTVGNYAMKNTIERNSTSNVNTDPLSKIFYGAWFLYILSLE
jgi:hypothetical protein